MFQAFKKYIWKSNYFESILLTVLFRGVKVPMQDGYDPLRGQLLTVKNVSWFVNNSRNILYEGLPRHDQPV